MLELSIIIVHYRNPALLKMCLNSIYNDPPRRDFEVIVIDSQSIRESQDLMRESFPQAKLIISAENTGYAHGVNIGLIEARGRFIMILNYDTILIPEALDKLCDFISQRPDIGLIGPQLLNIDGTIQQSYFKYYTPMTIVARRLWLGGVLPF